MPKTGGAPSPTIPDSVWNKGPSVDIPCNTPYVHRGIKPCLAIGVSSVFQKILSNNPIKAISNKSSIDMYKLLLNSGFSFQS
jgi:hypothetical protein